MPIRPSVLIGKQIAELLDPSKAGDGYFYLKGDANTDGSWRVMVVTGKIMSFQYREAGSWSIKLAINADESKNYIQKTEDINAYINMDELRAALAINGEGAMDGRTPILRATDSEIQWQYEGEDTWRSLIDIANYIPDVKDGLTPQLRVSGGFLQSSEDGINWSELFDLNTIRPEDARNATFRMNGSVVQWQLVGDTAWNDLFDTAPLKGADGKTVSLRNNAGVIQQSIDGQTWTDLFIVPRNGQDATQPTFKIGSVASGSSPSVSLTAAGAENTLSFVLQKGDSGSGVSSSVVTYQASPSGTAVPAGTWSASIPAVTKGQFLWTRTVTSFTDGTTSTAYSVAYHAIDGSVAAAYLPQTLTPRTIAPGTAYQHTDLTKPYKVVVNARSTQTVLLGNLSPIDKVELRVGPTAASVAPGGTGGFPVAVWETGITGLSLMIGASIQDGGQMSGDVSPGWFFRVNVISGNSATIVSCFTQSLTP